MKSLVLSITACLTSFLVLHASTPSDGSVLESFTVTTENAIVREFTETSIQLKSDSSAYFVQLEPNKEGQVIFALTGIGYRTTAKLNGLAFGVRITGFKDGWVVHPTFSLDDINSEIEVKRNTLRFEQIYGALPVRFDQSVDSINLEFFNNAALDMGQYFGLQDMRIVPIMDIASNPELMSCRDNHIMIGIDGSSSIDKHERSVIGNQMSSLIRKSTLLQDSSTFSIMEFGMDVYSIVESADKRELVKTINKYKKDRNHRSKTTTWTNWSAAFDEAIDRRPDIFIFITDGWSNWVNNKPATFSAQYAELVAQCNTLKQNGTRILFITSGLDNHEPAKSNLHAFLNHDYTRALQDYDVGFDTDLNQVDLISMDQFDTMQGFDLGSLLTCEEPVVENEAVFENEVAGGR